jgi:hypothetical protein
LFDGWHVEAGSVRDRLDMVARVQIGIGSVKTSLRFTKLRVTKS